MWKEALQVDIKWSDGNLILPKKMKSTINGNYADKYKDPFYYLNLLRNNQLFKAKIIIRYCRAHI